MGAYINFMYDWRKMTDDERVEAYMDRYVKPWPWHSPPHFDGGKKAWYIVTGACFEHKHHIGYSMERIKAFSMELLDTCAEKSDNIRCWCVLPNHYHILLHTEDMPELRKELSGLHGRTSRYWNMEEGMEGRKVWYNCVERSMRCDYHFWSSVNYIHHNPVKHGYVDKWYEWPFSSAREYIKSVGREKSVEIWKKYPITGYGEGWDE